VTAQSQVRPRVPRIALAAWTAIALFVAGCGSGSSTGSNSVEPLGRNQQLFVVSADGEPLVRLAEDDAYYHSPAWAPTGGRLAFVSSLGSTSTLRTADPDGTGSRPIARHPMIGIGTVAWSPEGTRLAYATTTEEPPRLKIRTIAANGSGQQTIADYTVTSEVPPGPTWSPDGKRIAYARTFGTGPPRPGPGAAPGSPGVIPGAYGIVVSDEGGRSERRVTRHPGDEFDPRWSPRGNAILFTRKDRDGLLSLAVSSLETRSDRRLVTGLIAAHPEWSPDGSRVAFAGVTSGGDRRYHLYVVSARAKRLRQLVPDEVAAVRPSWSPDGRQIAFAGGSGLMVVPVSGGTSTTLQALPDAQIPDIQVRELAWSADGRWLAFTASSTPSD
jgi:Tol biopolymer transport system component